MKYLDITKTIADGMEKYSSDPAVTLDEFKSLKNGNSCNLSKLSFGSHTGTHVDAPRHIFNRADTVDNIKIDNLVCDVVVTDIKGFLKNNFFKKINRRGIRGVLLKKRDHKADFSVKEAVLLVENGIRLIGTEQMSIEDASDKSHPVHRLLLKNGIIIVEGLYLKRVRPGPYKLICLPLKIKNGDGAPARAVLAYD